MGGRRRPGGVDPDFDMFGVVTLGNDIWCGVRDRKLPAVDLEGVLCGENFSCIDID